jgi:proteic killer suppression protein
MKLRFDDAKLLRMATDPNYDGGFSHSLADSFRAIVQLISDAPNETAFYFFKGLRFERLKGKRSDQHSMRLNRQFRLILIIEKPPKGMIGNTIAIKNIEDYHGRKNRR